MAPWYLPRSRSGMMSAIIAVAVTVRPPPPMPCSARDPISQLIDSERPASIEATVNSAMLPMKIDLRPNRSPNLPPRIVAMVWVRRYAVTTQLMCSAPPRSPTIVGSAVATIVPSSAARSIPPMISENATFRAVDPSTGGSSVRERSSTDSTWVTGARLCPDQTGRTPPHWWRVSGAEPV